MTDSLFGAEAQRGGKYHLYIKLGILLLLVLGSLIPLSMVRSLVLERKALSSSVEQELAATWGGAQRIVGPILVVPFEEDKLVQMPNPDRAAFAAYVDNLVTTRHLLYLLPEELDIAGQTTTSIRRRGIYEVPLFTAGMRFAGRFGPPDLEAIEIAPERRLRWEDAWVEAYISDLSGTLNPIVLNWDGRSIPFRVGTEQVSGSTQIVAPLALQSADALSEAGFSFEIALNGSDSLGVLPLGRSTRMALTSDWPHPSFFGGMLPASSAIGPKGFEANWQVSHFARQLPQQWRDNNVKLAMLINRAKTDGLAVRMVESVDHYLKAERSVKYGVLFVVLVCGVLFAFEVMAGSRVHVVQYGFVAAAVCIFFLLLLSLSEVLGFGLAYAVSTAMSLLLIAPYAAKVGQSWRQGATAGALLAGVYGYLYVTLQSEDHALIMGSLLLFVALAALMFATRNVDWYAIAPAIQRQADSQVNKSGQA